MSDKKSNTLAPDYNMISHKVKRWESLWLLARKYRTTEDEIREINNIKGDLIRAWKTIKINSRLERESLINEIDAKKAISNPEKTDKQNNNDIEKLFAQLPENESLNIELSNNKPALRNFIDPRKYKWYTFNLRNPINQEMQVMSNGKDWMISKNWYISSIRAKIWKWNNIISSVKEVDEVKSWIEVLSDRFVRKLVTRREALEIAKSKTNTTDKEGRRIIYYITDTLKFSDARSYDVKKGDWESRYKKEFIAFHWSGFDEEEIKKNFEFKNPWKVLPIQNNYDITQSAINKWADNADYAYLIWKYWHVFQFLDDKLWFWALWWDALAKWKMPSDMNRETIAIELALRWDNRWTYKYWVEDPNDKQKKSWKALNELLQNIHNIDKKNVITSRDPVRSVVWAHLDDFSYESRVAMWIQSMDEARLKLSLIKSTNKYV